MHNWIFKILFIILKAIGRLGGQSLKQECDQLKTKTLDQTNEDIKQKIQLSQGEIKKLKQSLEDLKKIQKEDQEKNVKSKHLGNTRLIFFINFSWNLRYTSVSPAIALTHTGTHIMVQVDYVKTVCHPVLQLLS